MLQSKAENTLKEGFQETFRIGLYDTGRAETVGALFRKTSIQEENHESI